MARIQTYVFIDIETTGLPKKDGHIDDTNIIELSMVAVNRENLLDANVGEMPRVQDKLTLCFKPRLPVLNERFTHLNDSLLKAEPEFNIKSFTMMDNFLSVLAQPVCFIAHNGFRGDYAIFKNHLLKLEQKKFTADIMCADSYHGFCEIKKQQLKAKQEEIYKPKTSSTNQASDTAMKKTTPASSVTTTEPRAYSNARRTVWRFPEHPWVDGEKMSFKLKDVYERELQKVAKDIHQAENDCIILLEIAAKLSKLFVDWIDNNHLPFAEIEAIWKK